ncbi:molybdenum cofactor guanylyltransferase [Oleidesulfovibrio sp.]|uniref:molybdenum cofactor guanylyltransferase n=1 Tax=Oleidesulfovibrio sp. TaxID=2909707 RepID=UPI003A849D1A
MAGMHADDTAPVGVVLAGGLSARLGSDKRGVHLFGEGEPDLLNRCAALLKDVVGEVWISVRDCRPNANGYFWLCDEEEGLGPLGGIMTALRVAQGPVLVLSCDLPFMDRSMLERLLAARTQRQPDSLMTTFVQEDTGYIEALVAIYEFGALEWFRKAADRGVYKVSRVVPQELQHRVSYSREESLPFFNVNYPADLEMARRVIRALTV